MDSNKEQECSSLEALISPSHRIVSVWLVLVLVCSRFFPFLSFFYCFYDLICYHFSIFGQKKIASCSTFSWHELQTGCHLKCQKSIHWKIVTKREKESHIEFIGSTTSLSQKRLFFRAIWFFFLCAIFY